MRKIILGLFLATAIISQAAENPKKESNNKRKTDGCTVTIGKADTEGNVSSASATAPTCSEAEKLAKAKLALSASN
jgi:hypothetical protein